MKFLLSTIRGNQNPKQTILSSIFSYDDSRVEFFENRLSVSQLKNLASLRGYVTEDSTFPKKIEIHSNKIIRPSYQVNVGGSYRLEYVTVSAKEVSLVELLLDSVVFDPMKERSITWNNTLLQKHGVSGLDSLGIKYSFILLSWYVLYFPLSAIDSEIEQSRESNIKTGLCTPYEVIGKKGDRHTIYEPVNQDINCSHGFYRAILFAVMTLSLMISFCCYTSRRNFDYQKTILKEFNSHDYDDMLLSFNKNHSISSDLDLDARVSLGREKNCSIRTLMLMILASFDPDACQTLFETILPKLQNRKSHEFELSSRRRITISYVCPEEQLGPNMKIM